MHEQLVYEGFMEDGVKVQVGNIHRFPFIYEVSHLLVYTLQFALGIVCCSAESEEIPKIATTLHRLGILVVF